jgi:hypothetical protein
MTYTQVRRLVRLHEKAEWHTNGYKRLLQIRSARSRALRHLQKAEQLYFQISRIIRDSTSLRANSDGNLPDSGSPMFKKAAMRFPFTPS